MSGTREGNLKRAQTLGKKKLSEIKKRAHKDPKHGKNNGFTNPENAKKAAEKRWAKIRKELREAVKEFEAIDKSK